MAIHFIVETMMFEITKQMSSSTLFTVSVLNIHVQVGWVEFTQFVCMLNKYVYIVYPFFVFDSTCIGRLLITKQTFTKVRNSLRPLNMQNGDKLVGVNWQLRLMLYIRLAHLFRHWFNVVLILLFVFVLILVKSSTSAVN